MKTVLTYIAFSALISFNSVSDNAPKLEDSKIIKDLNRAKFVDWDLGSIEKDPFENEKATMLPAPQLVANLDAKIEKLGDNCHEAVNLQFFTLDHKEEIQLALNQYLSDRALLFPTAPELLEGNNYVVLVWKPFCLANSDFEDDRMIKLLHSLKKKLKVKQSS